MDPYNPYYMTLRSPVSPNIQIKCAFADSPEPIPAGPFSTHIHSVIEFYILCRGDISFRVENSIYKMEPWNILVTKPNEVHNCIADSSCVHKSACLWLREDAANQFRAFTERDFGKSNLLIPSENTKQNIKDTYEKLRFEAYSPGNELRKYALCLEMLSHIQECVNFDAKPQTVPQQFTDILNDINANFQTLRGLEYLTNKYFISRSTLNRMFNQYLHTSPGSYIESKRLSNARILLKQGKSVKEAFKQSGFTDYSNFIKLFRKNFGLSPGKFQRSEETEDIATQIIL